MGRLSSCLIVSSKEAVIFLRLSSVLSTHIFLFIFKSPWQGFILLRSGYTFYRTIYLPVEEKEMQIRGSVTVKFLSNQAAKKIPWKEKWQR